MAKRKMIDLNRGEFFDWVLSYEKVQFLGSAKSESEYRKLAEKLRREHGG